MTHSASRIFVAGHNGMVGSAIVRRLARENVEILTAGRKELDLRDQAKVRAWIGNMKPDAIVFAAAKVGGIYANDTFPADFIYDNLAIETNIIHSAHAAGVDRLVFLGSSCIYPKFAPQPIKEESLLTGPLEPTNEWYAIAKIAGIKLCQAYRRQYGRHYISVMPCNLYGPNDNFDLTTSHVLPALIRKFHEAKEEGREGGRRVGHRHARYANSCMSTILRAASSSASTITTNMNTSIAAPGSEITIRGLAEIVGRASGFPGQIVFDSTKPDGTPRKLMDSSRIARSAGRRRSASKTALPTPIAGSCRHDNKARRVFKEICTGAERAIMVVI